MDPIWAKTNSEDISEENAIVYGRIIDSKSFFDESSLRSMARNITIEHTDVLRTVQDARDFASRAGPAPAPLKHL